MIAGHLADPVTWDCLACGRPWPCDPAREDLGSGMDTQTLGIYMGSMLHDAAGAMPTCPPTELHERFLAWVGPHPGLTS